MFSGDIKKSIEAIMKPLERLAESDNERIQQQAVDLIREALELLERES